MKNGGGYLSPNLCRRLARRDRGMRYRRMREAKLEAEFLGDEVCTLLANKERGGVCIRAKVVRADAEVDTLEVLCAVDAKALVDDAALLTRFHRACP